MNLEYTMLPPGPNLALQHPATTSPRHGYQENLLSSHGYQENLLSSSLVARLKQRHLKEGARPPKAIKNKSALKKAKDESGLKLQGLHDDEDIQHSDDDQSGIGSEPKAASKTHENSHNHEHSQWSRTGSAASVDTTSKLPRLTSVSRSPTESRISSRRSLSAGRAHERGDSRKSGTCASASSFAPRVPSCPVHIVKKDGVFQLADKYMPSRTLIREVGPATLWDYHTYVLPMMDSSSETLSPRFSDPDISPRGTYIGSGKKRMKVSWKAGSQADSECQMEGKLPESRQDTNPTPSTPVPASASKQKRAKSVDNLAFRRPVYTSGLSRVSSIGLRWEIQTGSGGLLNSAEFSKNALPSAECMAKHDSNAHHNTTMQKPITKPMWSYLITHDTQQGHVQLYPTKTSPPVKPARLRSNGLKPTNRGKHHRDVHPVSTAMEKYGTNVSKTRWIVPSSSTSGLDAERIVMDRLQLVKRSGSILLCEPGGRGTSNSAAQRFQQAMAAVGKKNNFGGYQASVSYKSRDRDEEEKEETEVSGAVQSKADNRDKLTIYTETETNDEKAFSTREDDQVSSPTKSRSTLFN